MMIFHRLMPVLMMLTLLVAGTACPDPDHGDTGGETANVNRLVEHVGRELCAECHENEALQWEGSQHDLAMQPATKKTVLGNFDDAEFTYTGVTSTFYRKRGKFMVRTDGPDGELQDFEIAYTFGIAPLQQYLIEFPGGRLQALNVCWDTRPVSRGGQRWFHLYPDEAVDYKDILHWTGALQNWNYMCSECHSTNARKGYQLAGDRYDTTWSEIDVSCEACHGPGSRHVEWARDVEKKGESGIADLGMEVRFTANKTASWILDPDKDTARRDPPRTSHTEIEACARCHVRRSQLTDDYRHGQPLADTHRVSLLTEPLYHADGQILEEVYVYGSFIQSAMYHKGVTCTDCHDPHTARLRSEGNATCAPCHRSTTFDTPDHHFHQMDTAASKCVACHMPAKSYMVVDPRRDHSLRIPRPDLTVKIDTPNACSRCHNDRSAEWATEAVVKWYGNERYETPHYAEAIHAGRSWQVDAGSKLRAVIDDTETPAIVRATALTLLQSYPSPEMYDSVRLALDDKDPLVRRSAAGLLELFEPGARMIGFPILEDPVRSVRIEAARSLASIPRDRLTAAQLTAREHALEEYADVQRFNGDRAENQLNLGWYHAQKGELTEAERCFQSAIEKMPSFSPAAVNLADLYRLQGRENEGEQVLRGALVRTPDDADLHHSLGLLLIRIKQPQSALEHFELAARLAPEQPRYSYVLGVALHSMGQTARALEILNRARQRQPANMELLSLQNELRNAPENR